jgi:hypothetical protein
VRQLWKAVALEKIKLVRGTPMKSDKYRYGIPPDPLQEALDKVEFLANAGIDPSLHVAAEMSDVPGFELGALGKSHLFNQAVLNIARKKYSTPPALDPTTNLVLGTSFDRAVPICINLRQPFRMLIGGGSGTGKTNLIFLMLAVLKKWKIKVLVWEYKPELRRVVPVWRDVIIFTPSNAPWKILIPIGRNKIAYYIGIISEIRHEFELHPATVPLIWQIIERMLRGMKPGDPPFCMEDVRRVLEHEAEVQKRENLYTAARAFQNICVVMGKQSTARVVPDIPEHFKIIGYDFVGQDPAILRLFLGFEFTRLLFQAQEEGLTSEFRQVFIFDEGSVLFSNELMTRGVAHISAAKRFVSMCRFTGTGFIIGVQNISQIDSFVTQNCDVFIVFRCTSFEDARLAAQTLGLTPDAIEELMRLPTGVAYVRAVEWERAIKINIPLFMP